MPRTDIVQYDIFDWVVSYLRLELDLGERSCYLTLDPDSPPIIPKGGDYFVTISPAGGEFIPGEQIPGNISERSDITVTVYSRLRLDSTDHDRQTLLHTTRGLIGSQMRVLAALVGKEIIGSSGETYLRTLSHVTNSTMPRFDMARGISAISVDVGIEFDWDLVSAFPEIPVTPEVPGMVYVAEEVFYAHVAEFLSHLEDEVTAPQVTAQATVQALAVDDATPSVAVDVADNPLGLARLVGSFSIAGGGVDITNFDDGREGQTITVMFDGETTLKHLA